MARSFDGGGLHYRFSIGVSNEPLSLVAWAKYDNQDSVWGSVLSIDDYSGISLHVIGFNGLGTGYASARSYLSGWANASITGLSNNTWYHLAGIYSSDTSRVCVLDGNWAGRATDTTSKAVTGIDTIAIGAYAFSSSFGGTAIGDIAECAVYNIALGEFDVAALAAGACPLLVRPDALVFYWPGLYSQRERLGPAMSTAGTGSSQVPGPPVIWSRPNNIIQYPPVPAAGGGRIMGALAGAGGLAGLGGIAGARGGLAA